MCNLSLSDTSKEFVFGTLKVKTTITLTVVSNWYNMFIFDKLLVQRRKTSWSTPFLSYLKKKLITIRVKDVLSLKQNKSCITLESKDHMKDNFRQLKLRKLKTA